MNKSLKELFDEHLSKVKFNQALANQFYRFQVEFVNKNEEHMAFFGGKMLGVQVVRFNEQDYTKFFDLIDLDRDQVKYEIVNHVDAIPESWKVANDVFSETCMYLIHRFLTSPLLAEDRRERAALDVALAFNYRWIAALIRDYFRFP